MIIGCQQEASSSQQNRFGSAHVKRGLSLVAAASFPSTVLGITRKLSTWLVRDVIITACDNLVYGSVGVHISFISLSLLFHGLVGNIDTPNSLQLVIHPLLEASLLLF